MATLLEIRNKVRQRADIQAETARYPDSELNQYINDSRNELFGILVKHSLIRDEATQTITSDGSATYNVDAAHYATLAVFKQENEYYRRLRRHTFRDRPFGASSTLDGEPNTYRIATVSGQKSIEFYPKPDSGDTYLLAYIPRPTDLSDDSDTLDDVLGWDEYVVVDAVIKCLRKEDTNTDELKMDKADLLARIEQEAEAQEMSEAYIIANVRTVEDYLPPDTRAFFWGYNGDIW